MTIARWGLCCLIVLLCACSPLRRGFEGSTLVSPAQPAVTISVDLPVLAQGRTSPLMYTELGYQTPEVTTAAYGTNAASPMALSVLAVAPDRWIWDPLTFSTPDSPVTSEVMFDSETFSGSLHIINGANDPFTPLVAKEQDWASITWLAQRYACRTFFNQVKLILEYREPLPADLADLQAGAPVPVWNEQVRAFQERAAKVFHVAFAYDGPEVPRAPYINILNGKRLGAYLGSMSLREPVIQNQ